MNPAGNAIIYYQAGEYSTSSQKLMGRHAASESFLSSWIRYSPFNDVSVMVKSQHDSADFEKVFQHLNPDPVRKAQVISSLNHEALKNTGCLYLPDPNLIRYAHLRNRSNRYNHSLCGVTHTIASLPTLEMMSNYLTAPIYPWDALICTSRVVQDTVRRLFDNTAAYLSDRFEAKIKLTKPMLPIIPLGVQPCPFNEEQTSQLRHSWRKKLAISKDAVVFLFYGRLSFHAKANPFVMYRALHEVTQKSDKEIVLIQAGWFANEGIENAFKSSAKEWAPNVKTIFVDGREPAVRHEIRFVCDIFMSLADNIQETFGLTPIEAMASGLPSIVSDWNGYKDTVRHGMDGYRIPTTVPESNDVHLANITQHEAGLKSYDQYIGFVSHHIAVDLEKCVEACLNLVENPDLRQRLGAQAKQRAEEEFAWEKIVYKYVNLFKHLSDIRLGSAHYREADTIHPVYQTPFEVFPTYPTYRLQANDLYCCASTTAQEELNKIYQNPMFNYGGLEPLQLIQEILKAFPRDRGISLKELPSSLGSAMQKERVICFLLKVGLLKRV